MALDYGRVLAGIQVGRRERARFADALDALGYPYWNESENPAYRLFLSAEQGDAAGRHRDRDLADQRSTIAGDIARRPSSATHAHSLPFR